MKRTLLVPGLAVLTALMLVACAGQESGEATRAAEPDHTATAAPEPTADTFRPASEPESTPTPRPTPVPEPSPSWDLPEGVALIAHVSLYPVPKEGREATEIVRLYPNERGYAVREKLLGEDDMRWLPTGGDTIVSVDASPDGSTIVATVCLKEPCLSLYGSHDPSELGPTALYESRDGGVNWQHLVTFEEPLLPRRVLPRENDDETTRVVMYDESSERYEESNHRKLTVWPDGELVPEPEAIEIWNSYRSSACPMPPAEGLRIDYYYSCMVLDEEREIVYGVIYPVAELACGAMYDFCTDDRKIPDHPTSDRDVSWLSIRNVETGEHRPVRMARRTLGGDSFHWVTAYRGPFVPLYHFDRSGSYGPRPWQAP